MKVREMRITPELAAKFLERNTDNRPLNERYVDSLAAEMSSGRWLQNGDTVSFSGDRLIDGQHRLWAVMKSGATIQAIVVEGLADEVFVTKDIGRRRNASDMLHIAGLGGGTSCAAAAALLHRYLNDGMFNAAKLPSHAQIVETMRSHPGLLDAVRTSDNQRRIAPKSVISVFRYLTWKVDRTASEVFLEKAMSGVGTSAGEPVAALHRYLMKNATSRAKAAQGIVFAVMLKAWNAERAGKAVQLLTYRPSAEAFPRAATG